MAYATAAQFVTYGLPRAKAAHVLKLAPSATDGELAAALAPYLDSASAALDSYLGAGASAPLASPGLELARAACHVAAYDLMSWAGFDPDGPDGVFKARADAALAWAAKVGKGGAVLAGGAADATPAEAEAGAYVASLPPRGWRCR